MTDSRNAQAAQWFVKLDAAQNKEAVRAQLQRWLDESPENLRAYREVEALARLWNHPSAPVPNGKGKRIICVVIVLCVLILALARPWLGQSGKPPGSHATDLTTTQYESREFELGRTYELPDGSTALLDANTAIHVDFGTQRRKVVLDRGRVRFIVTQDPAHPFEVTARRTAVRAIGTIFSVSLEDHDAVVTVVEEGRVLVSPPDAPQQSLSARQAARVDRAGMRMEPRLTSSSDPRLDWLKGRFDFEGESLAKAVEMFNQNNLLQLEIVDPRIAAEPIGGQYSAHDPKGFAQALEELGIGFVVVKSNAAESGTIRLSRQHR